MDENKEYTKKIPVNGDSDETFVFEPVKEEKKPIIKRDDSDIYSEPRNVSYEADREYRKAKEKGISEGALIGIIAGLVVLIIVAIIVGVIVIKGTQKDEEKPVKEENKTEIKTEETEEDVVEEETVIEEEPQLLSCFIIFDSESIEKDGNIYTIRGDVYSGSSKKYSRRFTMTSDETTIREDGEDLRLHSFMDVIEGLGNAEFMFDVKINEDTNTIVSVSYSKNDIDEVLKQTEDEDKGESDELTEEDSDITASETTAEKSNEDSNNPTATDENKENSDNAVTIE